MGSGQGEVTFDIRRGRSRRRQGDSLRSFLGVPNLHPTLWSTACSLAGIDRHNKEKVRNYLLDIYVGYRLCDHRQAWCRLHGLVLS